MFVYSCVQEEVCRPVLGTQTSEPARRLELAQKITGLNVSGVCDIIKQTRCAGRSGSLMVSPLVSGYRIKRSEFKPWPGNLCYCFEQDKQTTKYSVQSRVDPAATTTILPYVCLGVWCFSLFIVVYIDDVIYRKISVILIGC